MSTSTIVAVDDGYALIKCAYWGVDGKLTCLSIPSAAVRGRLVSDGDDRSAGAYSVGVDERGATVEFTIASRGISGDIEPTRIANFPESDLNRALVHHVLVRAGFGGQNIVLGTALPMRGYFVPGAQASKIESLAKPVTSLGGQPVANIAHQHVYAQALSAWVDHVIDENGEPIIEKSSLGTVDRRDLVVGVVDVGGRTTDFAVIWVTDGEPMLSRQQSGSVDLGMLDVMARLKPAVNQKFGLNDITELQLENALRTGVIRLWGEDNDVRELIAEAATDTARRLVTEVQRALGSGSNLDRMLFVGGGSVVLREALAREYQHIVVSDEPGFANARGMLKYMTFIDPKAKSNAASASEGGRGSSDGVVPLSSRRNAGA